MWRLLVCLLCSLMATTAVAQESGDDRAGGGGEENSKEHAKDRGKAKTSTKREAKKLSDGQIAKILIRQSRASYSGNCPCPYNRTARGHRCGRRSAYSRPGGAEPLCYRRDVSDAMIEAYRAQLAK